MKKEEFFCDKCRKEVYPKNFSGSKLNSLSIFDFKKPDPYRFNYYEEIRIELCCDCYTEYSKLVEKWFGPITKEKIVLNNFLDKLKFEVSKEIPHGEIWYRDKKNNTIKVKIKEDEEDR